MPDAIGEYKIIHGDETVHTSDHGLMREWGISGESAGSIRFGRAGGTTEFPVPAASMYWSSQRNGGTMMCWNSVVPPAFSDPVVIGTAQPRGSIY